MANIKVSLWHNVAGEIVAIGRPMGERKAVPVGSDGLNILDVEVAEEEISSLPRTHVVDSSSRGIVRRSADGSTAN